MPPTTPSETRSTFFELRDAALSSVEDGSHLSSSPLPCENRIRQRRTDLSSNVLTALLRHKSAGGIAVFALTELYLLMLGALHAHYQMRWDRFGLIALVVNAALMLTLVVESVPLRQKVEGQHLTFFVSLILTATLFFTFYLVPESRSLFIPFLFLVVAYGMYRIEQGNMLLLSLIILLAYGVVTGLHHIVKAGPGNFSIAVLDWTVLAISLSGFVLLAGKISRLHLALRKADLKLRHIEEHARRDPFLECYNRRYIVAALEDQKRRTDEQQGVPLCLAMIDLDHFKRINDEAGHLAGDEVLLTFSRLTQRNIRQKDIFGRYGGEEFVLILPDTSLQSAFALTERIREDIQNYCWNGKLHRTVTVSIGLAQYLKGESVLDFFCRTDAAMYLAKRGGRNKVVVDEVNSA